MTGSESVQTAIGLMNKPATRLAPKVEEHLDDSERVIRMAKGDRAGGAFSGGVLVLTDRRVFFLKDGPLRKESESIPLDLITAASVKSTLLTSATIKITGAQSNETVERVNKADASDFVTELRRLLNERSRSAFPATQSSVADLAEQLTKLGELRDKGLLSDAEFEAHKAKLLR